MIKIFETFAGIGSQKRALENIGVDHESVGVSEWYIDAIIAYDAIHYSGKVNAPDRKDMIRELQNFTFSADSKKPYDITRLNTDKLTKLYIANKRIKNVGSISDISSSHIPDHDLLTYSFPCQDLSLAGWGKGLKESSGTRSSLLWQVKRILFELDKEDRKPKYLMMENVPNVVGPKNINEFNRFKKELSNMGYKHSEIMLNSLDFGIPQTRNRFFMISSLDGEIDFDDLINRKSKKRFSISQIMDPDKMTVSAHEQKYLDAIDLSDKPLEKKHINLGVYTFNQANVVQGSKIDYVNTITHAGENSYQRMLVKINNKYSVRYLNARQNLELMGFTKNDYKKISKAGIAERRITALAGNSIVVNVLEGIFERMLKNEK